ncbi:MAG: hypothetical protein HYX74_07350 [Acidobacteria bacterium]|nr:hypothetical protein [Acidobacteriota bacterium]
MTDMLDVRMAHLEGVYEQVDRRLGVIETTLVQLRSDLNASNGQLRAGINQLRSELMARIDSQFHWLLGTIFTSWVTLLLAIFFRSS